MRWGHGFVASGVWTVLVLASALVAHAAAPRDPGVDSFKVVRVTTLVPDRAPPSATPTTFLLPKRVSAPAAAATPARVDGLETRTVCGAAGCVDGLVDRRSGRVLIGTEAGRGAGPVEQVQQVEQRVVIASADARWVSAFVVESELWAGAAHANNTIACRTFDRHTGRPIGLAALVGRRAAARALAFARADELQPEGVFGAFRDANVVRVAADGGAPHVVLCADTSLGAGDGTALTLDVTAALAE